MVYDDLIFTVSQKPIGKTGKTCPNCPTFDGQNTHGFPKIPRPRHQEDQAVAEIAEQRQRNMHLVKQNQDLHKTIVAWSNIPGWMDEMDEIESFFYRKPGVWPQLYMGWVL